MVQLTPLVYTPDLIKSFKSNLHIPIGIDSNKLPNSQGNNARQQTDFSKHYFQVLIYEEPDSKSEICLPKLLYGTARQFKIAYGITVEPSLGSEVELSFITGQDQGQDQYQKPEPEIDPLQVIEWSTVRFLLQCRQLSQMIAFLWLKPKEDILDLVMCQRQKYTKKIFDAYNDIPDTFVPREGTDGNDSNDGTTIQWIQVDKNLISQELSKIAQQDETNLSYLIKPRHIGYKSIALALLLSGQAYHKVDGKYVKIWESIFSTYELIWEYALDISWDTFYATRIDISQSSATPEPPYTKVTLSYPPRPSEFSVKTEDIKEWATAPVDEGKYPFYPKDNDEWNNHQVKFVVPPCPYIPLSCV